MRLGTVFPQTGIGTDPVAIRDFAQAVEGAGFSHMLAFDHILGAHPDRFGAGQPFAYDWKSNFVEPLVLFSHLAAVTSTLEFVTSVIVLPQRQTPLAAKQIAGVVQLSGGRLRLVVGLGWNFTEYEAMGKNFKNRAARIEEQIALMRRLWTEEVVSFDGKWEQVNKLALSPRPSHEIPIWIGSGGGDRQLKRISRIADGWMPLLVPGEQPADVVAKLRTDLLEQGRDQASFPLDPRVRPSEEGWLGQAKVWRDLGVSHLTLNTALPGRPGAEVLSMALNAKRAYEAEFGVD